MRCALAWGRLISHMSLALAARSRFHAGLWHVPVVRSVLSDGPAYKFYAQRVRSVLWTVPRYVK